MRHVKFFTWFGTICLALTITGCANRLDSVNARIWNSVDQPTSFPEVEGPLAVPWLKDKSSFGIAFSGGGTRSATATLGQLRALNELGWLDEVKYISAVSGGSWTSVPYTYLPEEYSDHVFFGKYTPPSELSEGKIKKTTKGSMADAIQDIGYVSFRFLGNALVGLGDESFSQTISEEYLAPFDLDDREKFFSFHEAAIDNIIAENTKNKSSKYYMKKRDFYQVKNNRPYLLVGGSLIYPRNGDTSSIYPFEMTPLYTGVRNNFTAKGKDIGGGYVESFAYDSKRSIKPLRSDGLRQEFRLGSERHRFTLADMVGTSGAAPQQTLLKFKLKAIGFPEFKHWPITEGEKVRGIEIPHGDGGHIDNIGLMPLLVRKVDNILVFVNTPVRFNVEANIDNLSKKDFEDDLVSYFKYVKDKDYNEVIDNGQQKFKELHSAFTVQKSEQNAGPLVHCDTYDIKDQSRYGISAYKPNICWVYLDKTEKWLQQVKQNPKMSKTYKLIDKDKKEFKNFPHFATFAQEWKEAQLIDLERPAVNVLSNLTAWTVFEKKEYLAKNLGIKSNGKKSNVTAEINKL